ncbi:hypothetical protein [Pseudomonas sp. Q1-7]|uniref:hypothetical protein n=1 Tax=Pseudomonas sp. Q1-7 TaxID=3020843 RepID=UPI0023002C53|nr:hypothetical protein [Pseudomonas sp. Q1-7]
MSVCKVLWLPLSLLLSTHILAAPGVSDDNARVATEVNQSNASDNNSINTQGRKVNEEHRKAIEAHIRHSNYQVRLLMRSASMSNIDTVLDAIDALRKTNEKCVQHIELCRDVDTASNTAGVSSPLQSFGVDSKL